MRVTLYKDDYFIAKTHSMSVILLTRSANAFPSVESIQTTEKGLEKAFDKLRRGGFSVVIDLRDVTARHDPEFEKAMGEFRRNVFKGWRRIIVVTKTASGQLQVRRHSKEDEGGWYTTNDLDEALRVAGEP